MAKSGPLQGAGALPVVLASTSIARRALLQGAGLAFEIMAPGVDEDAVKRDLAGADAACLATALADRKALAIRSEREIRRSVVAILRGRPEDKGLAPVEPPQEARRSVSTPQTRSEKWT